MVKRLTGKALAEFEAERDVWQEVLDCVKEIKAGGGKRNKVDLVDGASTRISAIRQRSS